MATNFSTEARTGPLQPFQPFVGDPPKPRNGHDVWLAVRVPIIAENREQAEGHAFAGVTEMLCQLLAADAERKRSAHDGSETECTPDEWHAWHEPTVLHFSEVAVRVLNQMSAEKRAAEVAHITEDASG